MPPNELSIDEISAGVRQKKFSATEVVMSSLERIDALDERIGAFLTVMRDESLADAKRVDDRIARGEHIGSLAGVPVAVKDNTMTRGVRTTAASKILEHYVASYDATAVKRLRDEGAIIVGKTNLDEFGMGASTENSAYQKTKNPWNLERVPGGSSGGSAAAVAARMVPAALGSDTGGSIRQPAALCGGVGLKPTYGRVSRYGLIAMTSSLDQIGPLATSVRDAAALFLAVAGKDRQDTTSADEPLFPLSSIEGSIAGKTIGIPKEFFVDGMDERIRKSVYDALDVFKKLSCKVREVSVPHTKYALPAYYITVTSEVSANMARYDGVRYGLSIEGQSLDEMYRQTREAGFGPEVKRRIILGAFSLSKGHADQYYQQAQRVRDIIGHEYHEVLKEVDCLITPTSPSVAFTLGEKFSDPLTMYLCDIFTVPANIANLPAISVPCGQIDELPVGLQVIGRPFEEQTILQMAQAYEQATSWHLLKPEM